MYNGYTYRIKNNMIGGENTNNKIKQFMNSEVHKQYNIGGNNIPLFPYIEGSGQIYDNKNIKNQTKKLSEFDTDFNKLNFKLIIIKNKIPQPLDNIGDYNKLYNIKTEIDEYSNIFYKYIRLTNPYELVISGDRRNTPINIKVISRAYFKLWEILYYFKDEMNLLQDNSIIYGGIAEGPGGFIQSLLEFREKFNPQYAKKDVAIAITLRNTTEETTKWSKNITTLMKNKLKISYGHKKYNDGNLFNPDNIIAYSKLFTKKADIITADGGFFVKYDMENYKEQLHIQLFFNEILTALCIQKKEGTFILKIYDIFTLPTIQLIYLLTLFYDKVYITKPVTSRPANSEKYIVAIGFKGISKIILNKLFEISKILYDNKNIAGIINNSKNIKDNGAEQSSVLVKLKSPTPIYYIHSFIDNEIPLELYEDIRYYNNLIIPYQIKNINDTLILIKKYENKKFKNQLKKLQFKINKKQYSMAKNWANKYKIKLKN
jgi:23S rRNA U2552 (ribose-2'-O)-methylase RlmE/FtsJ